MANLNVDIIRNENGSITIKAHSSVSPATISVNGTPQTTTIVDDTYSATIEAISFPATVVVSAGPKSDSFIVDDVVSFLTMDESLSVFHATYRTFFDRIRKTLHVTCESRNSLARGFQAALIDHTAISPLRNEQMAGTSLIFDVSNTLPNRGFRIRLYR